MEKSSQNMTGHGIKSSSFYWGFGDMETYWDVFSSLLINKEALEFQLELRLAVLHST